MNHKSIHDQELLYVTRQLYYFTMAKYPIIDSIIRLSKNEITKKTRWGLIKIYSDLRKGKSLKEAFRLQAHIFGNKFVQLIEIGEKSGYLENILGVYVNQLEQNISLKKQLKSAIIYPAITLTCAFIVLVFMLMVVVPTFEDLFVNHNLSLPPSTVILLNLSKALKNNSIIIFVSVLIFGLLTYYVFGKMKDRFLLHKYIPFVRHYYTLGSNIQVLMNLNIMLLCGFSLTRALDFTSKFAPTIQYKRRIFQLVQNLKKGEKFSEIIMRNGLLGKEYDPLLAFGESSNKLTEIIRIIIGDIEGKINRETKTFLSLIEPLLIVLIGIFIASILFALYTPMFEIMELSL